MKLTTKLSITAFLLLVVLLGVLYAQDKSSAPQGSQGRFQIVPSQYVVDGARASITRPGVFRIDTETGKAWLFSTGTDSQGKFSQIWLEIQ
jgi:hypothetical protein